MNLPSQEYLQECFSYNKETGVVIWKHRPLSHFPDEHRWKIWLRKHAGREVGYQHHTGYLIVNLLYTIRPVHRVIWKMVHNEEPKFLDHKNGDRIDNRIDNLRPATKGQNNHNAGLRRDNSSGFKGVSYRSDNKKWRACINVDKKRVYLGNFDTPEAAHEAYLKAARELHGEFMREV